MADGSAPAPTQLKFPADNAFQRDLRDRVDAYFAENHVEKGANRAMWLKVAFWLVTSAAVFAAAGLAPVSAGVSIALWALGGFCLAFVEMNVGHDAIHGSLSSNKQVNQLFSLTFDAMGASSTTWKVAHNLLHHTYTNVPGVDADIEPGPFLRFNTGAKHYPWHRLQTVYVWALYCLVAVLWIYQRDFFMMAQRHPRTGKRASVGDWAGLFLGRAVHVVIFLVVPLTLGPQTTTTTLIGYACLLATAGFTLSIVFQLAHVVEGVRYISPDESARMPRGWMEHELLTTANFGTTPLATFLTGGLDHQIEHHLFPHICHIHYPALSPIVRACAADHGIPYLHSGTFLQAWGSHTRMLGRLGRNEDTNLVAPAVARDESRPTLAAAA